MTTITVPATSISPRPLVLHRHDAGDGATAFAGFAPSFYLRSASYAGPPLTPFVMFHGVLMTVWMLASVCRPR